MSCSLSCLSSRSCSRCCSRITCERDSRRLSCDTEADVSLIRLDLFCQLRKKKYVIWGDRLGKRTCVLTALWLINMQIYAAATLNSNQIIFTRWGTCGESAFSRLTFTRTISLSLIKPISSSIFKAVFTANTFVSACYMSGTNLKSSA